MNQITLHLVDTLNFYQKGFSSTITENSFRYELMKPIEPMWNYLNTPLTPKNIGGYDSLMASEMLGIWTPKKDFSLIEEYIPLLKETHIFEEANQVIQDSLKLFDQINYSIPLSEVTLNILLGDSENSILMESLGYSGFGGIPGYILLIVLPNKFNKTRLKSALAHEFNHNIRFTYEAFNHGNVSVEDYLVIEGLAEIFAEELYGIEYRGPWIQDYDEEEMSYTIEVMRDGRHVKGFEQVAAYMYGDEVAKLQGFSPVGVSRNAGYTIGYHLVKEYLKNTNATIAEATVTPTNIIIEKSNIFNF